jgi:hypothetical protein
MPTVRRTTGNSPGDEEFSGEGAVLGRHIKGGVPLPIRDRRLIWAIELLFRHMLVIGAPHMGKSETLIKLVFEVAKLRWEGKKIKIIFVDAKSDYAAARRMVGLWEMLGRGLMVVPVQHLNGFCGDGLAVAERLNSLVPHAKVGSASWWRDIAEMVIRIVCLAEAGPPRSSIELLRGIDFEALDPRGELMAAHYELGPTEFKQARLRYGNLWGNIQNRFDGKLGLEDVEDVYVLCASLGEPILTEKFSTVFFNDLMNFLTKRKDPDEAVLLVVDEFPALSKFISLEEPFEQLRGKNVGLILAAQSMDGIGDVGTQRRYLAASDTKIVHGGIDSDLLIEAAGMKKVMGNPTRRYGVGSDVEIMARLEERSRITGDNIGELPTARAIVIRRKRASYTEIEQAPLENEEGESLTDAQLPPEDTLKQPMLELAAPPEAAPMDVVRRLAALADGEESGDDSEAASGVLDEPEAESSSSEEADTVDADDDSGEEPDDGQDESSKGTAESKGASEQEAKASNGRKAVEPPTTKAGWFDALVPKRDVTKDEERQGDKNE